MRDSREETYPQSELLEDVKKTKETCASIHMLLTKKDEDDVETQDEMAEASECWRRVGRLEGELQQARDQLERVELVSETLEQKNQSLEQELARCRERRNELEKLLDESALEANKIQKRHDEQLEDLQSQLAEKDAVLQQEQSRKVSEQDHVRQKLLDDSVVEANKLQKKHDEQLAALRKQLVDSEARHKSLQQKHHALQKEQEHRVQAENNEKRSELLALEASFELEQAQHSAEIEQQKSELEVQRRAFEQEVVEFRARDRSLQTEKENKKLRETVQEQKRVLSDLESELRQERNMGCLPKPGDYLRMVKQREGEGFARDNTLLKLQNKNLEHSLQKCQQAMGKHLPVAAKSPMWGGC